jgi:hypothetical protein
VVARGDVEHIDVLAYPEAWLHTHGGPGSTARHSHPLRPDEDRDDPDHWHEGEDDPSIVLQGGDPRLVGRAVYPLDR